MSQPTPATAPLTPRYLVTQAVDAAHGVTDPQARAALLEGAIRAAVVHGLEALAIELLLDLPDAAGRGALRADLADRALARGEKEAARRLVHAAASDLRGLSRWRPRPGWLSPATAAARLCGALVELGSPEDVNRAEALAQGISGERAARARALLTVAGATRAAEGEEDEEQLARAAGSWDQAVAAIREVSDPSDRRSLMVGLAEAAIQGGDPAAAVALGREALAEAGGFDWLQRVLLLEGIAAALAGAGWREAARWAWEEAIDLAVEGKQDYRRAVAALCRIGRAMRTGLSAEASAEPLQIALAMVGPVPLGPEARAPDPWGLVREAFEGDPPAMKALVAALDSRAEGQPAAWQMVRAQACLADGRRSAVEKIATSLEALPEREARAFAAILRCVRGGVEEATSQMEALLAQADEGESLSLPTGDGAPMPLETAFVRALLKSGATQAATQLAGLVTDGPRRAALLAEIGEALRAAGQSRSALEVVRSAAAGLMEPGSIGPGLSHRHSPGAELVRLFARLREPGDAKALLLDLAAADEGQPEAMLLALASLRHQLATSGHEGLVGELMELAAGRIRESGGAAVRARRLVALLGVEIQ